MVFSCVDFIPYPQSTGSTDRSSWCEGTLPRGWPHRTNDLVWAARSRRNRDEGVVNPINRTRTPRIHSQPIPECYARVSVDRVELGCDSVPLNIEGGDGDKTLGEAKKTFICRRKRFIIISRVSPLPPCRTNDQDRQHRCVDSKTIYLLTSYIYIEFKNRVYYSQHLLFS